MNQALAGVDQLSSAQSQLADAQAQLDAAKAQLEQQRASAEAELADAQATLDQSEAQLAQAEGQLTDARASYEDGLASYQEQEASAQSQLDDAQAKIDDAQTQVDSLEKPEVYLLDRTQDEGVETYMQDTCRMDGIANVFPVFFFLVAALVALTTMTRMVEDDRVLIGTLKALGYSKGRIASRYLCLCSHRQRGWGGPGHRRCFRRRSQPSSWPPTASSTPCPQWRGRFLSILGWRFCQVALALA